MHEDKSVLEFINYQGDSIDLSDRKEYKKVVIRNCPNVDYIALDNCGLEELIIEYCPKLNHLQAYNNNLVELKLSDFPELERIYVPFNRLRVLEIGDCPKLDTFYCNSNNLKGLDVSELVYLKKLYCHKNMIEELNCSNLTNLEELFCQECSLKSILLENCRRLRVCDLAENNLRSVDVTKCSQLVDFSCRDNMLRKIDLTNNKELTSLFISNNKFPPMNIDVLFHLTKLERLQIGLRFPADFIEEQVDTAFTKYAMHNKWFGSLDTFKSMANLNKLSICATDIEGILEDLPPNLDIDDFNCDPLIYSDESETGYKRKVGKIFELWKINREMRRKQGGKHGRSDDEGYISDNTSSNTNTYSWDTYTSDYLEPHNKNILRYYDISHQKLSGNIVFDGWPKLKRLNVGDNELNGLAVRNCPNLEEVDCSHNNGKMEPVIDYATCPNLKIVNKTNWLGEEDKGYSDITEEEKDKSKDKYNKKLNDEKLVQALLARAENGENINLNEILNLMAEIDFANIDPELQGQLDELKESKQKGTYLPQGQISDQEYNNLEPKTKELYAFGQIEELIKQANEAIERGDEEEYNKIIAKMQRYKNTKSYSLKQKDLRNLKRMLAEHQKQTLKKVWMMGTASLLTTAVICLAMVHHYLKKTLLTWSVYWKIQRHGGLIECRK